MSSLAGQQVGEYVIERELGEGGMGEVWVARHPIIGKRVAVKVLKRELATDPSMAQRFIEEARAIAAIRHPSIADIFGFGTLPDGRLYLVMELLEGESFSAYLKQHAPLPPAEATRWLLALLEAVGAAHAAGIVHRDLKPGNLFLAKVGHQTVLKVLDFGIARRVQRDERLTAPNMLLGSPSYVSPEQIRGEASYPSDLYAIGCIAWAMLAGRVLFNGETLEVLNHHLLTPPPPPSAWVPAVPASLDAFVLQLLEKQPEARPKSALAARDELRLIAHELQEGATTIGRPPAEAPAPSEKTDTQEALVPEGLKTRADRPALRTDTFTPLPPARVTQTSPLPPAQVTQTSPLPAPVVQTDLSPAVVPQRRALAGPIAIALLAVAGLAFWLTRAPPTPAAPEPPKPVVAANPPAVPAPSPEPVIEPKPQPAPEPAPSPEPALPVAKTEPPRPRPATARPTSGTRSAPTLAALQQRLARAETAVKQGRVKGAAALLLDDLKEQLQQSSAPSDRLATELALDDWERKYLH